jgi:hypothetical protein
VEFLRSIILDCGPAALTAFQALDGVTDVANRPELIERVKAAGGRISETLTRKTHVLVVDPRAIIDGIWAPTTRKGKLVMSRMVVVVTPAWVSNAIEQEIEVNKRRPKVTDIGIVKLPVVVHGSMSEVELPPRKRKRTK